MKRLLLTLIVLALTIITVDAAAATVCHAEWLPDDTQTKTIEEGDTAAFQWYATTNYDGLDATIKLYKGNDAIHTYDPGTLGGSYAGGEQDVTTDHYQGPGDYEVLVKCSDTWGFTYQHSIDLTVEEADHDIISVQATADPSSGEAPLQVELTCTAEGGDAPLTYSWDLGDGDTATGSQLTHTYSEGSYEPTCTVTDQDGDSLLDSATVTVTEADVDFTDITVNADPEEGDAPLTTDLTCTAEGGNDPVTYSWDLGDGQTATGSSVTHTYQNPSTYNATCTAEDADGDEIEGSVAVAVSDPDVPIDSVTVTADPDEGEDPLTTDLTCTAEGGNAPLSYSWDLDDGQTASGQQLSHTYSEGSYEPTCTVTDQDGDSLSGSATVEVSEPDVPIDSVTVTADPDEGEDPLTTDLTCTAEGGNAPLSYSWDLDDGTSASGSQLTHTYSEGSYEPTCTVTDVDGDSLSDSATVTVTEADVDFTDITVNADPEEGDAPLTTDLTCTAEGGNDPVTYSWDLGDGQTATGSSVTHTYQNPGAYNATCTAEDADGDTIEGTVTVTATQANRPPVMQPVPDQEVPEEQAFSYSLEVSDPDGDELECYAAEIPSWLSLDEDGCELYGTAPGVEDDKRYDVTVGVEDPEGLSDEESFTITVLDDEELLVIDEFGCNPDVVQGERQYCSAKVTDDEGALVEDADVTMSYHAPGTVEGALFADCTTNEKGYCAVDPVINEEPGDYTVEAVATKQGYGDSAPIYDSFTVWEQRYKIKDFDVYDDESFSNPEDEFFRGDAMYSSFAIYDLFENEYVCDDSLVKDVFLRVYNEEPLPFEEWEELQKLTVETVKTSCVKCAPCEYRYWLESIPLSDDYLGDGRVFAFAFNFTDGTAGQASKEVTVLNNPVTLDLPSEVVLSKYEAGDSATETLDLEAYADDLETPDGELVFDVFSTQGLEGLQYGIDDGVLTLTAPSGVTGEGTITIGVDDTDGSTAEDTMDVEVTVDFVPEPPVADAGPDRTVETGETVGFDGGDSYDPDGGDITSYEWDFGNGDTATGVQASAEYDDEGDYTVTLTVTDDEGDTDTDTADVTVSQANRPPVMQPVADQETPEEDFYSYELQVSDPDGDELECYAAEIPSWLSLDEDGCELYGTAPGVEDDEQYDVTVGVEDPEGLSDEESFTITVTKQPFIVIDEAGCNPDVVRGHRQYCSAHVTDDDGEVLEGAEVAFSYDDGDSFGACTTNEKGYCAVDPVIDREPGVYTAGVAAEKDGYVPAQPEELQFRVWEQRYEIRGLEVYDDDEFSNPEDEFFRGDAMYSSFAIYDLIEERYVCDDSLVKDVFLRVYNEEPLPFDEWQEMAQVSMKKPTIFNRARGFVTGDKPACEYRYWLESIPLSDDYLGDGRVFAFAFNFTDGTAG
ncbi:MAG: PKD domain-containing protein, partial [Candidatus Woesearchaeota archaeon]